MPEIPYDTKEGLDDVLKNINRFFIGIDRAIRQKKELKNFDKIFQPSQKGIFKALPGAEIYKKMCGYFVEKQKNTEAKSGTNESKKDGSTGRIIYEAHRVNIKPMLGIGTEGQAFYNEGLIIGAKIDYQGLQLSYRVDYDEKKKFHINFKVVGKADSYPIDIDLALQVVAQKTTRYSVSEPKEKDGAEKQLQLIKFKCFVKLTLTFLIRRSTPRAIDITPKNKDDQILLFLQNKDFNLSTLLNLLYATGVEISEAAGTALKECKDEKSLLSVLKNHKCCRDALVDHAVKIYSANKLNYAASTDGEKEASNNSEDRTDTPASDEAKNARY